MPWIEYNNLSNITEGKHHTSTFSEKKDFSLNLMYLNVIVGKTLMFSSAKCVENVF